MEDFKSEFSREERKLQTSAAMKKYNGRIPVFVYKHHRSQKNTQDLTKHKFLVPTDITVGQFVFIIRKNLKLDADQGIFIFVGNTLPPTAKLMSEIYREHGDEDGFLYVAFSYESVFG
jgi:GABA(A) receptor-associated protein